MTAHPEDVSERRQKSPDLSLRLNPTLRRALTAAAAARGMKLATYLKTCALYIARPTAELREQLQIKSRKQLSLPSIDESQLELPGMPPCMPAEVSASAVSGSSAADSSSGSPTESSAETAPSPSSSRARKAVAARSTRLTKGSASTARSSSR